MIFPIGCLIFCTIIGVPIFVVVFAIRQEYFNQSGHDDGKSEIFLSFKDFIDFYNLNQDRYEIGYDYDGKLRSLNIKEEYDECPNCGLVMKRTCDNCNKVHCVIDPLGSGGCHWDKKEE